MQNHGELQVFPDKMLWMARTPYKQTELASRDFYTTGDIGLGLFIP